MQVPSKSLSIAFLVVLAAILAAFLAYVGKLPFRNGK